MNSASVIYECCVCNFLYSLTIIWIENDIIITLFDTITDKILVGHK